MVSDTAAMDESGSDHSRTWPGSAERVSRDLTEVCAVVVTFNSSDHIDHCLSGLYEAGVASIVVVDNDSDECIRDLVESHPSRPLFVQAERNLGFGTAVNLGASHSPEGSDLLFVNPDCLVDREVVARLERQVRNSSLVGIATPAMVYPDGTRGFAGGGFPTLSKELLSMTGLRHLVGPTLERRIAGVLRRLGIQPGLVAFWDSLDARDVRRMDWVSGYCMYFRRRAWDLVGGFDERFFMYFEDVAICKSLLDLGYAVELVGDVSAIHVEGASSSGRTKSRHYTNGMCLYFKLYGNALQRTIARLIQAVLSRRLRCARLKCVDDSNDSNAKRATAVC